MTLRKLISAIHFWVGISAGLIVSIVGLTGAIYVFAPEFLAAPVNAKITVRPGQRPITPYAIALAAEQKYGRRLVSFQNQRRAERYYSIGLIRPELKIAIDPYTGKELEVIKPNSGFWYWVLEIHTTLTMGEFGSYVTGICSMLLAFVLISSGLYLWWPRSKASLKQRFKLKRKVSFKRRNYELHSIGGFYLHLFIGLLAFSGACFTFQQLGPAMINFVTGCGSNRSTVHEMKPHQSAAAVPILFSQVLQQSNSIFPEYHLMHVYFSEDQESPVILTKTNHQWISSGRYIRTYTYLDRYTGKILYQEDPRNGDVGERLTDYYKRQIHYGEIGGWTTRIIACLTGLTLPGLYISGIIIWQGRKKKKKVHTRS